MTTALLLLAKVHAHVAPALNFPGQHDVLSSANEMSIGTAILITLLGIVYLLYGFSMYKGLVMLNAVIVGGLAGAIIGQRFGGYTIAGGLLGAIITGGVTWPFMKYAVALMGGICGAFVGAAIWLTAGLEPHFAWAGGMTGLVAFGLFAFILFRGSIIMYTSVQGAAMVVTGILGLIFKHQDLATRLATSINSQPLVMPILVLVPAILGLVFQQTHSAAGGGDGGGDKKK